MQRYSDEPETHSSDVESDTLEDTSRQMYLRYSLQDHTYLVTFVYAYTPRGFKVL